MQARAWQDVVNLPLIDRVKDRDLVRNQAFINGEFVSGPASGVVNVVDPGNGVLLGTVPDMSEDATLLAIGAAKAALVSWRAVPARERGLALRRWYDLIVQNADDLAMIMTSECGKPFAEVMSTFRSKAVLVFDAGTRRRRRSSRAPIATQAKAEMAYSSSFVEFFSEEAKRIEGGVLPGPTPSKRIMVPCPLSPSPFPLLATHCGGWGSGRHRVGDYAREAHWAQPCVRGPPPPPTLSKPAAAWHE